MVNRIMVTDMLVLGGLNELTLPLLSNAQHGPHYDFRMRIGSCFLEMNQPTLKYVALPDVPWESQ